MTNRVTAARERDVEGRSPVQADKRADSPEVQKAKAAIRESVLAEITPEAARVFDAFCGRGEMYWAVWHRAARYVGCDEIPWHRTDPPRFVADNLRLMRAIDLQPFNVFDLDPYTHPWDQAELLLHRKKWAAGERGALVLTDGCARVLRAGMLPGSMRRILGMDAAPPAEAVAEVAKMVLAAWVVEAKVKVLRGWNVEPRQKGRGVRYVGLVFEGAAS